ncbi:hypothetical protein DIZ76_010568 [Coccidioides immitis]|nr:hypothetical protein DIZ76_010568 [Coccidioides immitis]
MTDRRSSISSEDYKDPIVEEGKVGLRTDLKTLKQLSSSAEAAKENRAKEAKANLLMAVKRDIVKEGSNLGASDKEMGKGKGNSG